MCAQIVTSVVNEPNTKVAIIAATEDDMASIKRLLNNMFLKVHPGAPEMPLWLIALKGTGMPEHNRVFYDHACNDTLL